MINFNIYSLIWIFISFLYVNTSLSSTIVSHKAYYDLEFLTNETSSLVNGGTGKSSFFLEKQCEGWALKETFAITPEIGKGIGKANYGMQQAKEKLTERNPAKAGENQNLAKQG